MKKILLLALCSVIAQYTQAQSVTEAIQYGLDNTNGTARFRAMGGAFGALGADMSAISLNPAGSALFTYNQGAATLSSFNTSTRGNYFGNTSRINDGTIDINQIGAVWVFTERSGKSDWKNFSLAINYENQNNFLSAQTAQGFNPNTSIDSYFLNFAQGIPFSVIQNNNFLDLNYQEQQAWLGYEGFIINNVGNSSNYTSNISGSGNYFQSNTLLSNGLNGKLSFNFATSYKNRLYLGLNLNSHFTDFTRRTSLYEDYRNSPGHNSNSGPQNVNFINDLYTYGNGFSFQVGAIGKVTDNFRLGFSYQSPTWLRLNDENRQTLRVTTAELGSFFADPNVTIVYPTYRLRTPSRLGLSAAYVFGKKGSISFDYGRRDYGNSRFTTSSLFFDEQNQNIRNTLTATNEYRIGGEYNIKKWSVRGGYRFEESPFFNNMTLGDVFMYSGGLGYNFKQFKIDLAYTYMTRNAATGFLEQGLTSPAQYRMRNNNVSLTFAFIL
jgi:long-subunit fatty acid transport protein